MNFVRITCAALLSFAAGIASAQSTASYPSKPIKWLIPFSAGGPTDVLARAIAPKLSEALGQPVVDQQRSDRGIAVGEAHRTGTQTVQQLAAGLAT